MVISRFERIRIKKNVEKCFFYALFLLKVKTAVFLKLAVAAAVIDLEQKKIKYFWKALFFIFKPHAFQVGF